MRILLVFILIFSLTACGSANELVGKWNNTEYGGTFTIEFHKGNTVSWKKDFKESNAFTETIMYLDIIQDITYKIDGDKVVFTMTTDANIKDTLELSYEVVGNTLVFKNIGMFMDTIEFGKA